MSRHLRRCTLTLQFQLIGTHNGSISVILDYPTSRNLFFLNSKTPHLCGAHTDLDRKRFNQVKSLREKKERCLLLHISSDFILFTSIHIFQIIFWTLYIFTNYQYSCFQPVISYHIYFLVDMKKIPLDSQQNSSGNYTGNSSGNYSGIFNLCDAKKKRKFW